jgi:DNA (cytosine-5)-methyltransferase 1
MNDVDTTKTITHLSLCTGYEGIGLGLRRVLPDVREIAYVEIEAFAIANLANKIEKGWLDKAPIYTNLKTFPYERFRGRVDILSGGFPCQPFSVAGNKKATEDPRHLFPYIAKGIRECEPRIVFLENVEGIISSKTHEGQSVLQYVLGGLEEMGYRAEAGIFSASEVGAPHQRKRVFILGISNSEIERWRGWNDSCTYQRDRSVLQTKQEGREVVSQTEGCSREHGELVNTSSDERWDVHRQQSEQGQETLSRVSNPSISKHGELVHTESECDRLNKTESQGWNTTSTTSEGEELGNTEHDGIQRAKVIRGGNPSSDSLQKGKERSMQLEGTSRSDLCPSIQGCEGLSDTDNEGLEGSLSKGKSREEAEKPTAGCGRREYPARPNEEQYEWEEPRVIKAEPRLGGATDGTASRVDRLRFLGNSRVDRLRLLGNGVVPDTAAKAFTTLINRINAQV